MIPAKQQNERWSTNKSSIDVSNAKTKYHLSLSLRTWSQQNYELPFQRTSNEISAQLPHPVYKNIILHCSTFYSAYLGLYNQRKYFKNNPKEKKKIRV